MTPDLSTELAKPIRVLQIIVGAMIVGVAALLVVAQVVGPGTVGGSRQASDMPVLTYVAVACGGMLLVMSFVIPGLIVGSERRKIAADTAETCCSGRDEIQFNAEIYERTGSPGRLLGLLSTVTIIASAMVEGGGMLAGVAYLVEGQTLAAATAAVLILALVLRFPTRNRTEQWIADQTDLLRQEQSMAATTARQE